jgi:hypothetical protein
LNCKYYQAEVLKQKTWFLSAVFRNESNVTFARAIEGKNNNVWEFFVPQDQEEHFLRVIKTLESKGIVLSFEEMENRLQN